MERPPTTTPLADLLAEAKAVVAEASSANLTLRITGGVAIGLLCPSANVPPLLREYKDLDVVGDSSQARAIDALLRNRGYLAYEEFNSLHGNTRLLYWDGENQRQLDVFLDRIRMCHELDLRGRLTLNDLTIDPADLLLTKLQIVQTNERDLKDAIALFADCSPADNRVASVLGNDWGWWRTVTEVLDKLSRYVLALPEFPQTTEVVEGISRLRDRIDRQPKSLRWKARAKMGDRVRWYELPDEVEED